MSELEIIGLLLDIFRGGLLIGTTFGLAYKIIQMY